MYLGDEASVGDSGIEDVVEVYGEDGKETLLASGRNGVSGVSRAKGENGQLAKSEKGKEGRPTQSKRWSRRRSFGCRECIGELAKKKKKGEETDLAMVSRMPLKGYFSEPRKTRCSRVCGRPESSKISVTTEK